MNCRRGSSNTAPVLQVWSPEFTLKRQRSGGLRLEANPGKQLKRPYLEKSLHNKGLVEWLKV
jgi:hypothetical protein